MSWPTVVWRFIMEATITFVPTLSTLVTSRESLPAHSESANIAPKVPMSAATAGVKVDWMSGFTRASASVLRAMSTPASR
jgi:hypothetical protein